MECCVRKTNSEANHNEVEHEGYDDTFSYNGINITNSLKTIPDGNIMAQLHSLHQAASIC